MTFFRKRLSLAHATSSSAMRLSHSARPISALSTILASSPARSIGMVLTATRAGLGHRQPRRHHGRVVARPDQHAVARLDAEVLDQRVRQPVRPVGQLLVGAAAAVADQRGVVAEALLDHAIGQLDRGVEVFGILELRPVQQQVGPLLGRRQIVARERVDVRAGTEARCTLRRRLTRRRSARTFCRTSRLLSPSPRPYGERVGVRGGHTPALVAAPHPNPLPIEEEWGEGIPVDHPRGLLN